MARGRKRKQGKRTPSGQLSRAGKFERILPNEHAQAMQAMFGDNYSDPIGRAYASGLLGRTDSEGNYVMPDEAKAILDTARALFRAYWQAYCVGPYQSAIADKTGGYEALPDAERLQAIKRREEWLNECLRCVDRMGVRRQFDALVIDVNPDQGPAWLDALIFGDPSASDKGKLRAALDALEAIANDRLTRAA